MDAATGILVVLFVVVPLALVAKLLRTTKVTTHTPRREAVAYWADRNRAQRNGVRF